MAWFPALRSLLGAPPPTRGQLDARITSSPAGYIVPGQPYNPDWNVNKAVTEGYSYNPYVFRMVEFVAANERDLRIVLRRDDPKEGKIIDSEELNNEQRRLLLRLNRRANRWEVAKIWRHRLIAQMMLSARGVFIEVVRSRGGWINALYLLDPDRVEIVPGRRPVPGEGPYDPGALTPIEAFRVTSGVPGARHWDDRPPWDPNATPEQQPSGILWIRSPHPTILTRGTSPMEAAQLSAELDRQARLYNLRFMREDGRPGGVLAVKGTVDDTNAEIIKNRFEGNHNPGRTTVLEADAITWTDTSGTPREMQWGDTMDRTAKEFAVAWGLQMSVVTDSSGQTFDNADADYAKCWEHGMGPLFGLVDAQLDEITPGGLDDDTFVAHDTSRIWVLGRHQRAREDRAAADLDHGIRTIDEVREIYGLDPLDVPATRVLWIPAQRLAVGDADPAHDGDAEAAAKSPTGGNPPPPEQGALPPGASAAFGVADQAAELPGAAGTDAGGDGATGATNPPGPGGLRELVRAGRRTPGSELTSRGEPERKSLPSGEGKQRGARS